MANEPVTSTSAAAAVSAAQPHIRTFARDVARLSGKPLPPAPKAAKDPDEDFINPQKNRTQAPQGTQGPSLQSSTPTPVSLPHTPPEAPPAYVIPKAPSTDETREAVLARLRARADASREAQEPGGARVIPKAPSTKESSEDVLARLRAKAAASAKDAQVKLPQASAQAAPAPAPSVPLPPRMPQSLTKLPEGPERIHTYKIDFAEHAKSTQASPLTVLAAEADAPDANRVIFKEKKPFPFAFIAGLLLMVLGGGALFLAFNAAKDPPSAAPAPRVPSLIASDEYRELSGSVRASFLAAAEEPLQEGRTRVMYVSTSTTTPDGVMIRIPEDGGSLIRHLSLPMPDMLARAVRPESTAGVARAGEEQHAFFILSVDSFERAFAGMLAWEGRAAEDLSDFFPAYPEEAPASTTPASSPSGAPSLFVFKDELIENRNVRILYDPAGRPLMLYGFRDKETLIIARNEAAYLLLLARLSAQGE